jgi:hypothetical protein
MIFLIISLVSLGLIGTLIMIKSINQKSKIKSEIKQGKTKIKLDTDVEGFAEVKRFDRDRYIEETFNQIFHAIQVDEWPSSFSYGYFEFIKDKIKLKIEYSDYDNFKIKSITLTSGYNNYHYRSDLDVSIYRFFYNSYADYINKENESLKKSTDDSLIEINKVLGKSTIRDSKIDQLLDSL